MSLYPLHTHSITRTSINDSNFPPILTEPSYGTQEVNRKTLEEVFKSVNTIGLNFLCELCRDKLEGNETYSVIANRISQAGFDSLATSNWFDNLSKDSLSIIKTMLESLNNKIPDVLNVFAPLSQVRWEITEILSDDHFQLVAKKGNIYLYDKDISGRVDPRTATLLMPVAQVITQSKGTLSNLDLSNLDLKGVNLSDRTLENVRICNSDLTNGNLNNTILRDVTLDGSNLRSASITNACMGVHDKEKQTRLSIQHVNFSDANLTGTVVNGGYLHKTDFSNANLSGVVFTNLHNFNDTKWNRAILNGTSFHIHVNTNGFNKSLMQCLHENLPNLAKFVFVPPEKWFGNTAADEVFSLLGLINTIGDAISKENKIELLQQIAKSLTDHNMDTAYIDKALAQLMPDDVTLQDTIEDSEKEATSGVLQPKAVRQNTFTDVQTTTAEDIVFLEEVANLGNLGAKYQLGIIFKDGIGVKRDLEKAGKLLKDAADKNHEEAAFAYAEMLAEQHPQSSWSYRFFEADIIKYYTIAANQNHAESAFKLARYYEHKQTKEGHRLAYQFYKMAADNGHEEAIKEITELIPEKAQMLFEQANQLWGNRAVYNSKRSEAICLYEQAAQFRHQAAAFFMAEKLVSHMNDFSISFSTSEDPIWEKKFEAWGYYEIADDYQNGLAMFRCGELFDKTEKGSHFYGKAAELSYPGAEEKLTLNNLCLHAHKNNASDEIQYEYAFALLNSGNISTDADRAEAKKFFQLAAKQGHIKAKEILDAEFPEKSFGFYATTKTEAMDSSHYDQIYEL